MKSGRFAKSSDYRNYIPVEKVKAASLHAEHAESPSDCANAVEKIRLMAHAHALASEAAHANIWEAQNDELQTATSLSTAAGQLFLRSGRHEHAYLSSDQDHIHRSYFDRLNAAIEFLGARRQAIAAAIARTTLMPQSSIEAGAGIVLDAICNAIANSGCPSPDFISNKINYLNDKVQNTEDHTHAFSLTIEYGTCRMQFQLADLLQRISRHHLLRIENLSSSHLNGKGSATTT